MEENATPHPCIDSSTHVLIQAPIFKNPTIPCLPKFSREIYTQLALSYLCTYHIAIYPNKIAMNENYFNIILFSCSRLHSSTTYFSNNRITYSDVKIMRKVIKLASHLMINFRQLLTRYLASWLKAFSFGFENTCSV